MNFEQTTPEEEFQELEISMTEAKQTVELGKAAERLYHNSDFKKVILDGYFLHEAARMVLAHNNPGLRPEMRALIMDDMKGPAALSRYLSMVVQSGHHAQMNIAQTEEEMASLMSSERGEE